MIDDGAPVETPEQLEAWIGHHPEVKRSLEGGGYGTEFSAADLFPLLQARLPAVAPAEEAPPVRRAPTAMMLVGVLLVIAGAIWFLQGIGALPGSFMTGQGEWAVYGGIAFALGLALVLLARHRALR